MDTVGAVTVPTIVAANHQATSAINVNHPINSIPPHNHHHTTAAAHPRNILTIAHGNTSTSSASNSNGNTHINNSSLINSSSLIINSNSSSSSSSSSSASSGYDSTSATPTNSYETNTAATTPIAIASEPIIPIATVAAVSPYYSESLTTQAVEGQHYVQQHQQQQRQSLHHLNPQAQTHQHQLQQNLQHSQRQQYYTSSTYDYQQQQLLQPLPPPPPPPPAPPTASSLHQQQQLQQQSVHQQQQQQQQQQQPQSQSQLHSLALTYNMGSGSAAIDCTSVNSSSAAASAASYQVGGQYKHLDTNSINYERTHVARPQAGAIAPTLNYPPQSMQQQIPNDSPSSKHLSQSHAQQQQQFLNATTSSSSSSNSSSKSRSASSLSSSNSSSTTTKPQAAATPFYAQPLAQQSTNSSSFYDNLKHKMPHDYHDNFVNFPNAAAYHQQQKYYAAAKSQLKDASSYGAPPGLGGKSMFPNANSYYAGAATGQHATGGYDKYIYPTSYPSLAYESPPDPAYRKGNTTGSLNSHSWPWGIDYASGNSRTIPPPTGHIPTATVAPTHASYLAANASHLARDSYYMAHDKYAMKYDKYPAPYQQTYVSPPGARHHLWPGTHTALSERLPPPPHTLHSTPYYPANAPPSSLNARQTCCTQPYQPQSCYYPPPTRLPPHGQASAMAQTSAYLGNSGQPTANTHQPHLSPLSSSCKYGSVIDYGATNKLKNSNDLYLGAHYDGNPAPPTHHAYNYGTTSSVANQLYNTNQLHHGAQPAGPLITHESSLVSTPNFTNDLSLNTNTYDSYNHHHHHHHHHADPNHMNPQGLGGMTSNGPTVPGYAQVNTSSKRALLDYRKPPIQTQPTPAPQQQQSYGRTQNASAALNHYPSTDLLNTPETTTTFAEYEAQAQAIGYTAAEIPETVDQSGKANDEATKNLSLRDFIANWNDDEDECAANEDAAFDQSTVINEVLSAGTVAEPVLGSDQVQVATPMAMPLAVPQTMPLAMPVQVPESSLKPLQVPFTPEEEKAKNPLPINKNTVTIPESIPIPADIETSQYVNLPDIVIDIEKSNVPTTIASPPTMGSDGTSLVLDEFDVEKELDQLQRRKNETDSIIAKPSHDINSLKDSKQDTSINPKSKSPKDHVKVLPPMELDHMNLVQNKAVPATPRPTHACEHKNAATPTEQTLRDMEGYDSGSSRHSNESSLFEKEYETFINKITTNVPKSQSECEIEENVKEFSKFYKRKRKLRDAEVKTVESKTDEDGKRLKKSSVAEKAKTTNFPQVYTKKSRNRHLSVAQWIKNHPKRKWKPLSIYYKLIHSLRRYRRYRSKKARELIAELKEKHLPLIKRRSIKNYTIAENSDVLPLFNPESLKSLVLTVINSEQFRDRLLNLSMEACAATEQKHICTDPLCETCDVIRSLMEPERFDAIVGEQNIVYDSTAIDVSNGSKLIYLEEQRDDFTAIKQTESFGSQAIQLKPEEVILVIESDSKTEPRDRTQDDYRGEQTLAEQEIRSESSFVQTESYCKDNSMAVENLSIRGNKPHVTSCIKLAPLNIIDLDTIPDDVQDRRGYSDIMVPPEVSAPSVIKATATELSDAIKDASEGLNMVEDNFRSDVGESISLSDSIPKIPSDIISQISSVIQKVPVTSTEVESSNEIPELDITTNSSCTTNLDADSLMKTEFEKDAEKSATISTIIISDSETPKKESFDKQENTEIIVKIETVSDSESESESESSECDSDCSCTSCTTSESSDEDEKEVPQSPRKSSVIEAEGDLKDGSLTRRESFKRKTSNEDPESYPAYLKKPKSEFEETLVDMKTTALCTQPEIEKETSHDQLSDVAIETKDIVEDHKDVPTQSQSSAQQSCNANIVEIIAESDSETDSSSSEDSSDDDDTDLSQSENESDVKSSCRNDDSANESHAESEAQKLEGDMRESHAESEAQKVEGDLSVSHAESVAQKHEGDTRESHVESEAQKLEGDRRESHAESEAQKLERDMKVSHAESEAQKLEDDRACHTDDHLPTVECESIERNVFTEKEETNSTKQILSDSENALTPNVSLSEKVIQFIGNHILPESTQSATISTNLINDTNLSHAKSEDKRHDLEEQEVAAQVQEEQEHQPLEEGEHYETNLPEDLSTSQSFQDINLETVATDKPIPTLTDSQTPPSNLLENHNVEPIDYSKSRDEKETETVDAKKRVAINIFEDSSLSNNSQNNVSSQSAPARPRIILSIKRTPEVVESHKDTTACSEKDAEKYHYTTKLKSIDFTNDLHGESLSSLGSEEAFESENEEDPACVEIYNKDVINSFASKSNSKLFAGSFTKENSLSSRDFNAFNLSEIDEKMGDLFPHTSFGRVSRTFDIPEESLLSNKSDMCIEGKELRRSFECLQTSKESPRQISPKQNCINLVQQDLEKEQNVDSILDTAANSQNSTDAPKKSNEFISEATGSPLKNIDEEYGNPWTPAEVNDILKFPTPVRNFPEDSSSHVAYLSMNANSPLTLRKDEKLSELNSYGSDTFEDIHFQNFASKDQTLKQPREEGQSKMFPVAFGDNDAFMHDSSASSTSSSEELILNTSLVEVRNDTETPQGSMGNRVSVISFSHSNTETSDVTSQKEGLSRMICNTTYIDSMTSSLEHSVVDESSMTNTSDGGLKPNEDHEAEKEAYDLKQFNFHSIFGSIEKLVATEGELSSELQENSNERDNSSKCKEVLLEPPLSETYLDAKPEEYKSLEEKVYIATNKEIETPKQTLEPKGVIVSPDSPESPNSQNLQHETKTNPQSQESNDPKEYKIIEENTVEKVLNTDFIPHQDVSILHPITPNTLICDLVDAFVESAATLMEEKYEQVTETLTTEQCLPSPSSIESDRNENHDVDANEKHDADTTEVREESLPNFEVEMNKVPDPEALDTNQCSTQNGKTPAAEVHDEYPLEKTIVKDCESEETSFVSSLKIAEESWTDSQQPINLIKTSTANEEADVSPENLHANYDNIKQCAMSSSPTEINLSEEEKAIDQLDASIDIKPDSVQTLSVSTSNVAEETQAGDREISEEIHESFEHDTLEDNKVRSLNDLSADNVALLQSPPVGLEQPQVSDIRAPQEQLEEMSVPKLSLITSPKCYLDSNKLKESLQDDLNEAEFEKSNFSAESTSVKYEVENLQEDQLEQLNIPVQSPSTFEPTTGDEMEIPEDLEDSKILQLSSCTLVPENAAEEDCKYDEEEDPGKLPNCSKNTYGYREENETQQEQVNENTIPEQPQVTLSPREIVSQRDIESKSDNNFVSEEQEIALHTAKSNKDVEEVDKEFNKQEEALVGDFKGDKSLNNSNCYEIVKPKDNDTEILAYSEETRSESMLNHEEKSMTLSAKDGDSLISKDCSNVNKNLNRNNEEFPPSSETGNNFPDSKDYSQVNESVCKNIDDLFPHSKADDVIEEQPVYPRFGRFKSYLSKKLESHNEQKIMEKSKSLSNSQASSPKAVSPNWNDQPLNSEGLAEELLPKSCEIVTINECPKINDEKVCPVQDDKPSAAIDSLSNQMGNNNSLSSNQLESFDDEFEAVTVGKTLLNISAESSEENLKTNPLEDAPKGHSEDSLNSRSIVRPEVFPDVAEELASSTSLDKLSVPEDGSTHFLGFRNQSSFEDESDDFHGFEDQHEEDRIRREIECLNEDSAANDAFPCVNALNKKTPSDSGSMSSDLNELEALEKALSQHRLIGESDGPSEAEENTETSKKLVSIANVSISTNDIEHIKKMLESDEEHNDNENETQIRRRKEDINLLHTCKIPKLSDLCRAALNSSLIVSNKMTTVQSSPRGISPNNDLFEETTITTGTSSTSSLSPTMNSLVIERELSVEEALADMYRQAGVLLSDPEDTDNEKSPTNEEAQDVLLINLQEILNSDNDNGFVLQCDMNVNVQENVNGSANAHESHSQSGHENANNTTERVGTVQLIGFLNTNLETPEIHIISSDSESEVIILSDCDTDVEFSFSPQPQPPPPPPSSVYTAIDTSREYIPFIDDLKTNDDSQSDIWTIHHEEIVPDNLNKYLKEEFYRYLHEKYAQKKLSKYYHANRILRKYKKRLTNKCWQ